MPVRTRCRCLIYSLLAAFFSSNVPFESNAQEPVFGSVGHGNLLFLNPGYAGNYGCLQTNLHYLVQPQQYNTIAASVDRASRKLHGGLGLTLIADQSSNGNRFLDAGAIYTYKLNLSRKWAIKPAIGIHFRQNRFDFSSIANRFTAPTELSNGIEQISQHNLLSAEAGLLLFSRSFFAGWTTKNLNRPVESETASNTWKTPMRHTAILGWQISKSYENSFGSTLVYEQQQGRLKIDSLQRYLIEDLRYVQANFHYNKGVLASSIGYRFVFPEASSYFAQVGFQTDRLGLAYNIGISGVSNKKTLQTYHQVSTYLRFACRRRRPKYRAIQCPSFAGGSAGRTYKSFPSNITSGLWASESVEKYC